ncbi:MAG: hypothetical protein HGA67_03180 [Candidatus Yonathbacteria bacterium]|nr:hypothetical protein [Candidatus Yonathbacteria bacterium]
MEEEQKISAWKSASRTVRVAAVLGVLSLLLPTMLGMFAAVGAPLFTAVFGEMAGRITGFGIGIGALLFTILVVVMAIRAWRTGERSVLVWVGVVPAILIVLFWVVMIIGEFLFPH